MSSESKAKSGFSRNDRLSVVTEPTGFSRWSFSLDLVLPSDSHPRNPRWSELDPAARAEALEILARLIAQASAVAAPKEETRHDD